MPEGMTVAHWRAYCWDVHRGMALRAGSAYADINININININI